ncbi:unnamed protein product [Brassicogethes aeneus]|uniref:Uncharacterized protein n=1 Tax=Brassicogethes aeneus TaxID=1431903 RepID=A0A9P0FEV6_BRAAE|nr:unnamed protein product [Brassicogethes aeneus]
MHGVNAISRSPSIMNHKTIIQKSSRLPDKPPSVGHISFMDEPKRRSYQYFHSEPCSSSYSFYDQAGMDIIKCHCADFSGSESNMSPKSNIKLNLHRCEAYFNKERAKTRYI